jgi:hypothetical protein
MKLKLISLAAVFAAGITASFALADDGHGKKDDHQGSRCTEVHVHGTIAPQTLTVTADKLSKRLNLAAGAQVVLQVGAAGQTVQVEAEACLTTVGTTQQLVVKNVELRAAKTRTVTTTVGTTTHG